SGSVNLKMYAPMLINFIHSGKAHSSFIASAVINIKDAPEYYARFNGQEEVKVFIRFL
ncbi:hypothetical protein K469DRAFT_577166, partial [Zopfia rhizophila CBS 207.26]